MSINIGLTSFRVRTHEGIDYYVGYNPNTARFECVRVVSNTTKILRFDGEKFSSIVSASEEVFVGFDVAPDGTLVVDIPTDNAGSADRYNSVDGGKTWTQVDS